MRAAVDLHIHSALSPCADNEMTPNNIVNMARLKGLDIIAVTDHNSAENCLSAARCGSSAGILVIPGMELQTIEEIHLICLFPDMDAVFRMQRTVYSSLSNMGNNEEIFGEQLIFDENDEIKGKNDRLLISASQLNIDEACRYVRELGGAVIPAHVDRDEYSILSAFGTIPNELGFSCQEISRKCDLGFFKAKNPNIASFKYIRSSDAHYLGNILEREMFVEMDRLDSYSLIRALGQ
jgi:PHP family Zn ribbon phosphoesterase